MATVAKAFNTHQRRWVAGEPIDRSANLAPHSFENLVQRGFIDAGSSPAAKPAKSSKRQ